MMPKLKSQSWRDVLPIHPAATLLPRMNATELRELAEDIKTNGLKMPVVLWAEDRGQTEYVLDGINRLDALEMNGVKLIANGKPSQFSEVNWIKLYGRKPVYRLTLGGTGKSSETVETDTNPYAYVLSANVRRRHLTAEQKRDLIAKVAKENPTMSHAQIARLVHASPTTVSGVRTNLQVGGAPEWERRSRGKLGDRFDAAVKAIKADPEASATALAKKAKVSDKTIAFIRKQLGHKPRPPGRTPAKPKESKSYRQIIKLWSRLSAEEKQMFRDHIQTMGGN